MAADHFGEDDTESAEKWDACWNALQGLPGGNVPTSALGSAAAHIIDACRAATEGRGIEHIEERARAAYRLSAQQLAAGSGDRRDRLMVVLGGALNVLRRVPRAV